jgi:hypothetical protein
MITDEKVRKAKKYFKVYVDSLSNISDQEIYERVRIKFPTISRGSREEHIRFLVKNAVDELFVTKS